MKSTTTMSSTSAAAWRSRILADRPPLPPQFDERFYAVRRGLMDNVTGPTEIVDDLSVARLGLRNRWQTKRGPEGNRRIVDWVMFDTHFEIFPNKDDNFGENAGLLDYDFRWFVGDRLSILSSGAADFFTDGQRYVQVGAQINRPKRGNVYIGYRSLQGPIDANILLASLNYRLSAKWVGSAGISYDLSGIGALGETVTLTRIGESFLVSVAFANDHTRDNVASRSSSNRGSCRAPASAARRASTSAGRTVRARIILIQILHAIFMLPAVDCQKMRERVMAAAL